MFVFNRTKALTHILDPVSGAALWTGAGSEAVEVARRCLSSDGTEATSGPAAACALEEELAPGGEEAEAALGLDPALPTGLCAMGGGLEADAG